MELSMLGKRCGFKPQQRLTQTDHLPTPAKHEPRTGSSGIKAPLEDSVKVPPRSGFSERLELLGGTTFGETECLGCTYLDEPSAAECWPRGSRVPWLVVCDAGAGAAGVEVLGVKATEAGKARGEETLKAQLQPPRIPPAGHWASGCWPAATAFAAVSSSASSSSSCVATTATSGAAAASAAVAVAVGANAGPGKARHGLQLSCCPGEGPPLSAPARGCSNSS